MRVVIGEFLAIAVAVVGLSFAGYHGRIKVVWVVVAALFVYVVSMAWSADKGGTRDGKKTARTGQFADSILLASIPCR